MSGIAQARRRERPAGGARAFLALAAIGAALGLAQPAQAHGGKPDGNGCDHNRKFGWYHCHRGPLAGLQFDSKEAAMMYLQRLQQRQGQRGQVLPTGGGGAPKR